MKMGKASIPNNRSRLPRFVENTARRVLRKFALGSNISYGENLRVGIGATINSPHGLVVGSGVSIGQRSVVEVDGKIGSFCLIARHVQIIGRADHAFDEVGTPCSYSTWVGDRSQIADDAVEIGRDVWIGAGAIILGGVSIGDGSVIGAGTVVTNSLPPFSIAVGNPARVIRQRFNNDVERQDHIRQLDKLEGLL